MALYSMIPKTLSASSLIVAEGCMARWKAEYLLKGNNSSNDPARLGNAIHSTLENFVQHCWIDLKSKGDFATMKLFYMQAFASAFNTSDLSGDWYEDGLVQLQTWFDRQPDVLPEVYSLEKKETFDLPTSVGKIPFNYIYDRIDITERDADGEIIEVNVVDTKTWRLYVSADQMHKKIQMRVYALGAMFLFPKVERIWVTLDQTRHTVVSTVFTRAECRATWKYIIAQAERIITTSEEDLPETINPECQYCIRKASCKTLASNIESEGVYSLPIDDIIKLHFEASNKEKALKYLKEELAAQILTFMKDLDEVELMTDDGEVEAKLGYSRRTRIDTDLLQSLVTADQFAFVGGARATQASINKLIKKGNLEEDLILVLENRVLQTEYGDARISTRKG